MAPFGILLITLVAVVFNAIFGIPPFLFFGLGVCIFAVTAGAGPALVSVLLASAGLVAAPRCAMRPPGMDVRLECALDQVFRRSASSEYLP